MADDITIPTDDVKRFAYFLLDEAQKRLRADGDLPRLCWALTTADKVPENSPVGTKFERIETNNEGVPADQTAAVVVLDLSDSPSTLLTMISIVTRRSRRSSRA